MGNSIYILPTLQRGSTSWPNSDSFFNFRDWLLKNQQERAFCSAQLTNVIILFSVSGCLPVCSDAQNRQYRESSEGLINTSC